MKESDAWLRIAEAWDCAKSEEYHGSTFFAVNSWEGWEDQGLCDSVRSFRLELLLKNCMLDRITIYGDCGYYIWPPTKAGAAQRTWAAMFLAAMAEAEGK